MASIEELKNRIDLHDLAERLGLKPAKPGSAAKNRLYHAKDRKDEKPSLSVYEKNGVQAWKDHALNVGGTCIDMVMHIEGAADVADAMRRLHELYGWPLDNPKANEPKREQTTVEFIADRCLADTAPAIEYLVKERAITQEIAELAVRRRSVGFNTWSSNRVPAGEAGHGGPAVAFLVRGRESGQVVAVDLRYLDPALNGKVKTQCQGEKSGYVWAMDWKRAMSAKTVYWCESPINALSIESAGMGYSAAVAIRGVGNADTVDISWMRGKQAIIVMDNDEPFPDEIEAGKPHPQAGVRPGLKAAWTMHDRFTAMDISALLVDQQAWEHNDVNEILQATTPYELKQALWKLEQFLIPGYPPNNDRLKERRIGKARIFLPYHHDVVYWKYRVRPDFTSVIESVEEKTGEGGEVIATPQYGDLAGFRVAAISRVTIASQVSTMSGEEDSQPTTVFSVSVQTGRHGASLLRQVVEDEKLNNIETWRKLGSVFKPTAFLRMIALLEHTADLGARTAANFVGLCWRGGRLVVNQGPDCFFTDPDQQCPYHNLTFPSGQRSDARRVLEAYQATFAGNAATIALVWALGGHLKALLGFWPHMQMQGEKATGKSTFLAGLSRTAAFTVFSRQSIQTSFRLVTSISHTSHPVAWEEVSAGKQEVIDQAVGMLQESYQYTISRRGTAMMPYLLSAPVLLVGEDVPVRGLTGKLVRTKLRVKGPRIPEGLPRFPMRQWLEYLCDFSPAQIRGIYEQLCAKTEEASRASGEDAGAVRMSGNYAALLLCWRLLTEFAGVDIATGNFMQDLKGAMNSHISETSGDREPWVWITEILLAEIARGNYKPPFRFDDVEGESCLLVRTSDVMFHLQSSQPLREFWNGLPIKSDRVYKQQLVRAGVTIGEAHERTINNRRISRMVAMSISKLEAFGLDSTPTLPDPPPGGYST